MISLYNNDPIGLVMMAFDDLPSKIRILMNEGQPYANIYNANRVEWTTEDLEKFKRFWKCDLVKSLTCGAISRNDAIRILEAVEALR